MSILFLAEGGKLVIKKTLDGYKHRILEAIVSPGGLIELTTGIEEGDAEVATDILLNIESYDLWAGIGSEEFTKALVLSSSTGKIEDSPTLMLVGAVYSSYVKVNCRENTKVLRLKIKQCFQKYGSLVFANMKEGGDD